MHLLSKPIKTDLKLLDALKRGVEQVDAMTPDELEAMMKAQRASWCRQDLD